VFVSEASVIGAADLEQAGKEEEQGCSHGQEDIPLGLTPASASATLG
jgi:hypothetical protein